MAEIEVLLLPNLKIFAVRASSYLMERWEFYDTLFLSFPREMEILVADLAEGRRTYESIIDEISYSGIIPEPVEAWEYTAEPKEDFFAPHISGAQRLPNVNTLICEGNKSHLFEVTPAGEIVWDFVNPYVIEGAAHNIYCCLRYLPEHVRPLLAHSGQSAAGGRLVCSRAARPGGLGAAAGLGFVDWGSVHKMCAAW